MAPSHDPWTLRADGLDLRARTARDVLEGVGILADVRAALEARVGAVPEGGAANAAVGDLAHGLRRRCLRIARDAVGIAAGATSRVKTGCLVGEGAVLAAAPAIGIPAVSPEREAHR